VVRDRVLVAAVPLLLCAVAATQLYLVDARSLSRWKGGGFGMFTTVDSPSSRFLRIHLDTADGQIPVLIPPELRKLAQKARVLPSHARMSALADALRQGTWVYLSMDSALQYYRELLAMSGEAQGDVADDVKHSSKRDIGSIDFRQMQLLRMLNEDETLIGREPVAVRGVRLEVWQYGFDREELLLGARKVAGITAPDGGK